MLISRDNPKYRANVNHLADLYQASRHSPLEDAAWLMEFVASTGGAEHLKLASRHLSLLQLYNFIFTQQKCPAGWTKDIAYPLYKQGTKRDPTNYRLITLMSVMAKVFERIMHTRLTAWTHNTRDPVIDPTQVGFQANRCTLDHLYVLTETA